MIFLYGWKNVTARLALGFVCVDEENILLCLQTQIDDWSKDVDFDPEKIIIFDESELSLIEVSMKNLSYILDAAEIHLLSKIDERKGN